MKSSVLILMTLLLASRAFAVPLDQPATFGIDVSTQSILVAPAGNDRPAVLIQNLGVIDAYCGLTSPVTTTTGHVVKAGGGFWSHATPTPT